MVYFLREPQNTAKFFGSVSCAIPITIFFKIEAAILSVGARLEVIVAIFFISGVKIGTGS